MQQSVEERICRVDAAEYGDDFQEKVLIHPRWQAVGTQNVLSTSKWGRTKFDPNLRGSSLHKKEYFCVWIKLILRMKSKLQRNLLEFVFMNLFMNSEKILCEKIHDYSKSSTHRT